MSSSQIQDYHIDKSETYNTSHPQRNKNSFNVRSLDYSTPSPPPDTSKMQVPRRGNYKGRGHASKPIRVSQAEFCPDTRSTDLSQKPLMRESESTSSSTATPSKERLVIKERSASIFDASPVMETPAASTGQSNKRERMDPISDVRVSTKTSEVEPTEIASRKNSSIHGNESYRQRRRSRGGNAGTQLMSQAPHIKPFNKLHLQNMLQRPTFPNLSSSSSQIKQLPDAPRQLFSSTGQSRIKHKIDHRLNPTLDQPFIQASASPVAIIITPTATAETPLSPQTRKSKKPWKKNRNKKLTSLGVGVGGTTAPVIKPPTNNATERRNETLICSSAVSAASVLPPKRRRRCLIKGFSLSEQAASKDEESQSYECTDDSGNVESASSERISSREELYKDNRLSSPQETTVAKSTQASLFKAVDFFVGESGPPEVQPTSTPANFDNQGEPGHKSKPAKDASFPTAPKKFTLAPILVENQELPIYPLPHPESFRTLAEYQAPVPTKAVDMVKECFLNRPNSPVNTPFPSYPRSVQCHPGSSIESSKPSNSVKPKIQLGSFHKVNEAPGPILSSTETHKKSQYSAEHTLPFNPSHPVAVGDSESFSFPSSSPQKSSIPAPDFKPQMPISGVNTINKLDPEMIDGYNLASFLFTTTPHLLRLFGPASCNDLNDGIGVTQRLGRVANLVLRDPRVTSTDKVKLAGLKTDSKGCRIQTNFSNLKSGHPEQKYGSVLRKDLAFHSSHEYSSDSLGECLTSEEEEESDDDCIPDYNRKEEIIKGESLVTFTRISSSHDWFSRVGSDKQASLIGLLNGLGLTSHILSPSTFVKDSTSYEQSKSRNSASITVKTNSIEKESIAHQPIICRAPPRLTFQLSSFWKSFEEASCYGVEVPSVETATGFCQSIVFVPYLSAIQLHSNSNFRVTSSHARSGSDETSHRHISFSYFESKPPHVRRPFSRQIERLASGLEIPVTNFQHQLLLFASTDELDKDESW